MKTFRFTILICGIFFIVLTILLLIFNSLFPSSYLTIALANVFAVPIVWGFALILLWLLLLKMDFSFFTIVFKAILAAVLISLLISTFDSPMLVALKDLRAVIGDDLYVTEGRVVDSYIERKSFTPSSGSTGKDRFYQHFLIDNVAQDKFVYSVQHMEDYAFQLGHTYRITALPHSKQLLEYAEIEK